MIFFIIQYIVVKNLVIFCFVFYVGGYEMTSVLSIEALDMSVIRNILRSMINEHWSVAEALDEYDIPQDLRSEYEERIESCFID